MTELELVKNIAKDTPNYNRILREKAYQYCIRTNNAIKYIQEVLKYQRQEYKKNPVKDNILAPIRATYYNKKSGKYVHYTIYSKTPKFITYRQAVAITAKQLEKDLRQGLHYKEYFRNVKGGE